MNAKRTNENETQFTPQHDAAGWDPYEIWRTRVLLPRLEMTGEHEIAAIEDAPSSATNLAA